MGDLMIFALIGVGTLLMRAVFLISPAGLPDAVQRAMQHSKPAILAALVGGFLAGGEGGIAVGSVAAITLAFVLARRGTSMVGVLAGAFIVAAVL